MNGRVRMQGSSEFFTGQLKERLGDCGFEVVCGPLDYSEESAVRADEVGLFEVTGHGDISNMLESFEETAIPFVLYKDSEFSEPIKEIDAARLKSAGLMGVIQRQTSVEEVAFVVNRAFFYNRVVKRNPRLPVTLPVTVTTGERTMVTNSAQISRDGMFIITLHPCAANSICDLEFSLPGFSGKFKTEARVIYNIAVNKDLSIISNPNDPFRRLVTHPGMAVFFIDLEESRRQAIDAYIDGTEGAGN